MKKILTFVLAIVLCFGFAGCSKEKNNKTSSASSVTSGPSVFVGVGGNKLNSGNATTAVDGQSQVSNNIQTGVQKPDEMQSNNSSMEQQSNNSQNNTQSNNLSGKPQSDGYSSNIQINTSSKKPQKGGSSDKNSSVSSVFIPSQDDSEVSSVYNDPIPANAPRIICWGDSITYGMGMTRGYDYPSVLQSLLGNKYRVLNAGSSGEKSWTIAARQGAYDVTLDRDLAFGADYGSVYLDGVKGPNLVIKDGSVLDISEWGDSFNNDLPCKNVYIKGAKYELSVNGGLNIIRDNYDKKLVIKKGTKVEFESARKQQGSYCEIFYIGANDGVQPPERLVARYKAMAKRQGSDRYIVIIPQWSTSYTAALKAEFGDKAFDLREAMCTTDPEKAFNIYVSDTDRKRMENGQIPLMYMYKNDPNDTLHLSEQGYEVMAKLLYGHGKKLGYWK